MKAVATVAGCSLSQPDVDDDSIDFTIRGKGFSGLISRPQMDVQLKCLMSDAPISVTGISYPLKIKNYNDLRITDISTPRLLIVVVVPTDIDTWLHQSDDQTSIKYCGYWTSIRGKSRVTNTTSVSVHLPQANRLTPDGLRTLMQTIASGGAP